jgi:hypothetical protein
MAPPPPLPPPVSQLDRRHMGLRKERQPADGMGGGAEEPNHMTARKPSPLKTIQYFLSCIIQHVLWALAGWLLTAKYNGFVPNPCCMEPASREWTLT